MASRRKKRPYTPEEKLQILEEARQPGTTVAEVLRRHQVDPTTFYRWEQQAKEGMRVALSQDRRRTDNDAREREIERLRAEVAKKSRIIAEVIEENLDLKKNSEPRGQDTIHGRGEGGSAPDRGAGGGPHGLDGSSDREASGYSSLGLLRVARAGDRTAAQ
jgi:transposase